MKISPSLLIAFKPKASKFEVRISHETPQDFALEENGESALTVSESYFFSFLALVTFWDVDAVSPFIH